jgi:DNA repair protein REV1
MQRPVEESTSVSISGSKQEDSFDLPSFSQIDMTVFESLPHDLKEELKKEYSRRSGSPFASVGAGPVPKAGPSMVARTSSAGPGSPPKAVPSFNNQSAAVNVFSPTKRRSAPMFPTKKESNYKRITQQLAPKSGAAISPQKSMLYALLGKKPAKKTNRVSEAKLRELGIDPEVFAVLPKQVQDEQLVRARILKEKGTLPEPPSQRMVLKAKKPTLPPGFVVYRAPPPRAVYRERLVLRQQGKSKREKLAFTEADEVQNVLEKWVAAYKHWAPREKDVEYLSKFLLQSVDGEKSSDGGMVNAISVMKWWLVLLRRFWPGSEYVADEDEPELTQTDSVGQAWWDAFRKVKREMDVVARKKFGGSLSLK